MSVVKDYPRLPVRFSSEDEAMRRVTHAINYLLGVADQSVNALGQIEHGSSEEAAIRYSTTFTGAQVTDYKLSYKVPKPIITPLPQLIKPDPEAGTVTVGYAGVYTADAFLLQDAGDNNQEYAVSLMLDPGDGDPPVEIAASGTQVWTHQTTELRFSVTQENYIPEGGFVYLVSSPGAEQVPSIADAGLHLSESSFGPWGGTP